MKNGFSSVSLVTGTHHLIKSINRRVVLGLLCRKFSLSRIELSKLTGLDAKMITNLVREMLQEKAYLEQNGFGRLKYPFRA